MRPPIGQTIRYALKCRCPNCHQGRIFRGWPNKVWPRCPVCSLSFFREPGYYLGGMIITYILVAFMLLALYLLSLLLPSEALVAENTKLIFWTVFAILLTILVVKPAYSLWLALDFWIHPWSPTD